MTTVRTAADIAALAQLACLLEVSAPKPGNVSPGRHFANVTYEDFLTSAVAIGPAFTRVADQSLGATIHFGPQEIPGTGRFAVIADPQGATFAAYTPSAR
jgi:triphosphoribosyl-dephospho-CoA synthetase